MYQLVQRPIYLFVDQVALQVNKIIPFLKSMHIRRIPLVLIGAERETDWSTYCTHLEEVQAPKSLRVGKLSSAEVELLLDLLERHDCLGELRHKKRSEQVEAFMGTEYANRQLLVALHVLTRGVPFEKIVLDEYNRVPERARRLYLDIATMHQFAVPVRAGTISRVSGIHYRDYEREFFEPLKDLVMVEERKYDDYCYKTWHPNIAELVFSQVCDDDAAKAAQFIRLIYGFDVGYSSDRRTLDGICRGRTLARRFLKPAEARGIYEVATEVAPTQAYLYQQWAIFESTHPEGDILDAEKLAEQASIMEPGNNTFIHTQAEVARKRANIETSQVLKEQLRRQTRMFLGKMPKNDRFSMSSYCKLMVDEMADLGDTMRDDERGTDDYFFADKLNETESMLARAQQAYPDDPEMFETEARLWDEMKNKVKAQRALERAWKKSPRGAGTAIRLGKIYARAGRRSDELRVLKEALDRHPEDKNAHRAMAMHILADEHVDKPAVLHHLSNSFQVNDTNFEARFLLAEYLFAIGDVERSAAMFSEIASRAPKDFRRLAPRVDDIITGTLPDYSGRIEFMRDTHVFIRSGAYPSRIFAHRSDWKDEDAAEIGTGQQVYFRLRFNHMGPVAINVSLNPVELRRTATELIEELTAG